MGKRKNQILRNQEGFTLVEIIAVLVILGILAAVAVPKYFSMVTQAESKAIEAAAGNAVAEVHRVIAENILLGKTDAEIKAAVEALQNKDLGDFTMTTVSVNDDDTITVSVTGDDDTSVDDLTGSKIIPKAY